LLAIAGDESLMPRIAPLPRVVKGLPRCSGQQSATHRAPYMPA